MNCLSGDGKRRWRMRADPHTTSTPAIVPGPDGKPEMIVYGNENDHIVGLYEQGLITQETALAYASHKGVAGRGIDRVKSARGESTTDIDNLEIDRHYDKA